MRRLLQSAAAILLIVTCAAVAEDGPVSVPVEVGGVRIELPPPAGHVEIRDEAMRKFIDAITPAESRHLASYASAADIDRVLGGGDGFGRWASVHAIRMLENRPFLQADFVVMRSEVLTAWKDDLAKVTDYVDQQLVKSSERVRDAINVDMQFAASDVVPVEIVADEADAFSTMMLMRSEVKAQGQSFETRQIVTTTMMRVGDRVVALYYYDQHRSDEDIVAVREATRDWIAAVRAANTAPSEKGTGTN